mgnify:CR=1 FL=1
MATREAALGSLVVPPIQGFARIRSRDEVVLGTALSARAERPKCEIPPVPLTARHTELGVTPRNRAMLGPRPDDRSMRAESILLAAVSVPRPRPAPVRSADLHPRQLANLTLRGQTNCPDLTGPNPRSRDWFGVAAAAASEAADPTLAATLWLPHARGAAVVINCNGIKLQAELLGGPKNGGWQCRDRGSDAVLTVDAQDIRRLPPSRGDIARVVVSVSCGFTGTVLNVEKGMLASSHMWCSCHAIAHLGVDSPSPSPSTWSRAQALRYFGEWTP